MRFFTLVSIVAAFCAFGEEGLSRLRARALSPVPGAQWIWADGPIDEGGPVAFYALGEVELDEVPEDAELLVTGDEDYRLHVNDRWIGGGRYRESLGPDVYSVSTLLHPGRNRILVELRSSRGAGGLLAALVSEDRRKPLLVTDGRWRIARRYTDDLMRHELPLANLPLADLQAVRVWGSPPTGRWHQAAEPVARAHWFDVGAPSRLAMPVRGMGVVPGGHWLRLRPGQHWLPQPLRAAGSFYSWGREVTGIPVIDLSNTGVGDSEDREGAVALVRVANELEDFHKPDMESHYMLMIPMPGYPYWQAPEPVRFRYLEVNGIVLENRPFVIEVEAGVEVKDTSQLASQDRGVFGLRPLWQPSLAIRAALARAGAR